MRDQGYDGIVPVNLKFGRKYNFLLLPEADLMVPQLSKEPIAIHQPIVLTMLI